MEVLDKPLQLDGLFVGSSHIPLFVSFANNILMWLYPVSMLLIRKNISNIRSYVLEILFFSCSASSTILTAYSIVRYTPLQDVETMFYIFSFYFLWRPTCSHLFHRLAEERAYA